MVNQSRTKRGILIGSLSRPDFAKWSAWIDHGQLRNSFGKLLFQNTAQKEIVSSADKLIKQLLHVLKLSIFAFIGHFLEGLTESILQTKRKISIFLIISIVEISALFFFFVAHLWTSPEALSRNLQKNNLTSISPIATSWLWLQGF